MQEDRRGRPSRELDKDIVNEVFEEEGLVSTRELKQKYLDKSDEDGLGWNTLSNWLDEQEEFEVVKPQ